MTQSTFSPTHCGLYFGPDRVRAAQRSREQEPLRAAWAALDNPSPADPLAAALFYGLRWRFAGDEAGGAQGAALLAQGAGLEQEGDLLAAVQRALGAIQAAELLRDHPQMASDWAPTCAAQVDLLAGHGELSYVETLWLMALGAGAGVLLEDEARFAAAADYFRTVVQRGDIHPEGYIRPAVEEAGPQSFMGHLLATAALCLTAEIAHQAGVDLWHYEQRGVGVVTAVPYIVYYYIYPEQWRWHEGLTQEEVQQAIRDCGAFLEMANLRARPRDLALLLREHRPLFSAVCGGLTTLTHADMPRGLFGRR